MLSAGFRVNLLFFFFLIFYKLFLKLNKRNTCLHSYFKIIFQLEKNRRSVLIATADNTKKQQQKKIPPGFKYQGEWYKSHLFSRTSGWTERESKQ